MVSRFKGNIGLSPKAPMSSPAPAIGTENSAETGILKIHLTTVKRLLDEQLSEQQPLHELPPHRSGAELRQLHALKEDDRLLDLKRIWNLKRVRGVKRGD